MLTQLFAYTLSTAAPDVEPAHIRPILLDVAGPEGEEDVMNAGELLIEQGREQGREEGQRAALRAAIADVLGARSLALSDLGRARIASCSDVALLARWLRRAAIATSEAEVFAS